jgi:hypothetical protein
VKRRKFYSEEMGACLDQETERIMQGVNQVKADLEQVISIQEDSDLQGKL